MGNYLIGTDIGSSSTKTVITDSDGSVLSSATEFYNILTPYDVWAEQWPDVWLNAVKSTIRTAFRKSKINSSDVCGICISGLYGGSGVPLDYDMNPIRPCIIWMDRRANDIAARLNDTLDIDHLYRITENGIDPYYGYIKMLWIKENEPQNWRRIRMFLPPNQYVIYKITGNAVIDYTSAGNIGGIYEFEKGDWSDEMMEILGIPRAMMPDKIIKPTDSAGYLLPDVAEDLGLPAGIPVFAGCVDCLASTLATGAVNENENVIILSTSLNWGILHSSKPSDIHNISMPYVTDPLHVRHTLSAMSTAGALTRWFAETFAPYSPLGKAIPQIPFSDLEASAAEIPAGCDGLIMLPYFMGERSPIWDSNARGTIMGLTLHHTGSHVYRAILESVGYAMRHIMENSGISLNSDIPTKIIGGGSSSVLWTQILSDITGQKMICMSPDTEAPYGDAFMAGIGAGILSGFDEIKRWAKPHREIFPNPDNTRLYSEYYQIYKNMYLSLKNDMKALTSVAAKYHCQHIN